jgi:hypothetical protein
MPAISFPQALALAKGANYNFPGKFTGINLATLLSTATPIRLNQPSFVLSNSAPNALNSAAVLYTLASSTTINDSKLVYKTGGNLVDTAMKWTNGKSLGNWYEIQRHANTPTGGTVSSDGTKLKITCGPSVSTVNRSIIHDTLYDRNGALINPLSSGTVAGWLFFTDKVNATMYYKGYVEKNDFLAEDGTIDSAKTRQKTFFVGYVYNHNLEQIDPTLNTLVGANHGFGFIPVQAIGGQNYTWYAVVKATNVSTDYVEYLYSFNTNLSAFSSQKLKVNFTDGVVTFYANDMVTPVATVTVALIPNIVIQSINNPMYAGVLSQKGADIVGPHIAGVGSIYVEEAASWRQLPAGGKGGLIATLSLATNVVTLTTGTTTGLSVGMRLEKTSTGGGAFNALTSTTGVFIGAITSSTTFTVVNSIYTTAANHATAGSITFDAGLLFGANNYEDTNTEITSSDTQYHNTGIQILKKLK